MTVLGHNKEEFSAVIKIHNVNYSVFNLEGQPLFTSFPPSKNHCQRLPFRS